jgi:FtsP/CotA-like multicopper oxidase with cupredoxin domain
MMDRRQFLAGLTMVPATLALYSPTFGKPRTRKLVLRAAPKLASLDPVRPSRSSLWLYNGQTPGPEIRVRRGDRVQVRFINDLEEASSIHWHGIRIDNAMDGVPGLTQDPVPPGGTFDYDFLVPDAGTYWYHAHNHSWAQVGRGLYGPLIVEEREPTFSSEEDLTMLIDDWRLGSDGALQTDFDDYMLEKQFGRIGNFITVNGKPSGEKIAVKAGRPYRLRLINASNARIFNFDVSALNGAVIAIDGQPVASPVQATEALSLAPAQRIDLAFIPNADHSVAITDADGTLSLGSASDRTAELMRFDPVGTDENISATPILPVATIPEPNLLRAKAVPLHMEGGSLSSISFAIFNDLLVDRSQLAEAKQVWKFNGTAGLPTEPLFRVDRDQTVVVEMKNDTGFQHAMHVHGHHFRVLEKDGSMGANLWHDTFLIDVSEPRKIAFVANNPGRWLLHCHMLEHAAAGMKTWFEVV